MKFTEYLKAQATIKKIARRDGVSVTAVRESMQEAVDAAWAAAWTPGNITAQAQWQRLFPGGEKPTLEEFIVVIASSVERDQ